MKPIFYEAFLAPLIPVRLLTCWSDLSTRTIRVVLQVTRNVKGCRWRYEMGEIITTAASGLVYKVPTRSMWTHVSTVGWGEYGPYLESSWLNKAGMKIPPGAWTAWSCP